MYGTLYGIGIGPGDPELLTLKAVRIIEESSILAVPGKKKEETVAYNIVKQAVPKLDEKECLEIDMPMTKDREVLKRSHRAGADKVIAALREGKDVAFLTLGDPTVYATYIYIHQLVAEEGYPTEIISGITSFCAVAARLNTGLVEKAEMLHVIPSSYQIEEALRLPGVKVLMKAGSKLPQVKESLRKLDCQVSMIENCGMANEHIYHGVEAIPDDAGYYSLLIVKER